MHQLTQPYQIVLFQNLKPGRPSVKRCPRCGVEKEVWEFPTRGLAAPRPNSYCHSCQREYSRNHYHANARAHNLRRLANQRRYRIRNRELVNQYLASRVCIDCGEADPTVLEFDHVRGSKRDDVSTLVRRAFSWKRVSAEMAKCEVRCANCHRRKTAKQLWPQGTNGR